MMMNTSTAHRFILILPEEDRLVRQAKSGDTDAFAQLYDACVEHIYRYIYFRVANDRVAEGITFQVFLKAWEQLDRYQIFGSSFVLWLYSVAQNQVSTYYRTHKNTVVLDNNFPLAVRGGDCREEFQAIRNGLQFLTPKQQQALVLKFIVGLPNRNIAGVMNRSEWDVRLLAMDAIQILTAHLNKRGLRSNIRGFQWILEECLMKLANGISTLDECLARYTKYAAQLRPLLEIGLLLNLGREVKPLLTFHAYTRTALIQYMQTHRRQPKIVMPMFQRAALTFAMLVAALLVTGTAHAQSALPGDTFYSWKRTSEQVWRIVALDPIGADIIFAERRLSEWIAVANDPTRSATARSSYVEALTRFRSTDDVATLVRVVPMLQSQQQTLNDVGLSTSELDDYLIVVADLVPGQVTPTVTVSTVTLMPTPTYVPPTATEIPPTATEVPSTETEVPPTATEIPPTETEIPPTATDVLPTETEIPPTATEVPPTETEIPPTATEIPPTPTEGIP